MFNFYAVSQNNNKGVIKTVAWFLYNKSQQFNRESVLYQDYCYVHMNVKIIITIT